MIMISNTGLLYKDQNFIVIFAVKSAKKAPIKVELMLSIRKSIERSKGVTQDKGS